MDIDLKYTYETVSINNGNIHKIFGVRKWRRKIRVKHVMEIYRGLEKGNSLPTISVNKIKRKYWIIAGNHRYEAMLQFLEDYPDTTIEVGMEVYQVKAGAQEKELYHILNNTAPERTADFINASLDDIKVYNYINERLDCLSSYGGKSKLRVSQLLSGYLGALEENQCNASRRNKADLVEAAEGLTEADGEVMYKFLKGFLKTFGNFGGGNTFAKTTPFTGILRAYVDNCVCGPFKDEEFWDHINTKIITDGHIRDWSAYGGRAAQQKFHSEFIEKMNKWRSKKLYVLKSRKEKTDMRMNIQKFASGS